MTAREENPYQALPVDVDETPTSALPAMAEYMLEPDDVVALSLHTPATRRQYRIVRLTLIVGLMIVGVLTFLRSSFVNPGMGAASLVAPFAVLLAFGVFVIVWLSPPIVRRRIRRQCEKVYEGKLPWPQIVALSGEGVLVTTPYAEGRHHWEGVVSIDTIATHVFFYLSKLHAVIVPARAFRSEAQFHAFVELARQQWHRARSPLV